MFGFDGTNWSEHAKLTAADASRADSFGNAVAIAGNTAVIGARSKFFGSFGAAYIFRFDGMSWVEEIRLEANDAFENDRLKWAKPKSEIDPPRPGGETHAFRLPSEKEVDQALNYFERMLRKFQDRLKKLEQGQGDQPKQL